MGACLSCNGSRNGSSSSSKFDTIRLAHLNGDVEDFNPPLSVAEVMGKPPRYYVCTAAHLASVGFNPLPPSTPLQPGTVYVVLPVSVINYEFSPLDMAAVANRLTAKAKSMSSLSPKVTPSPSVSVKSSPSVSVQSSPVRSPRRPEMAATSSWVEGEYSCKSWKPSLDAIREASFTLRTDSDLREMHVITTK